MLTLNRDQLKNHYIEFPPGWSQPKFTFNQIVDWDEPATQWGRIVGFEYVGEDSCLETGWHYLVLLDPSCPYLKKCKGEIYEVQIFTERSLKLKDQDSASVLNNRFIQSGVGCRVKFWGLILRFFIGCPTTRQPDNPKPIEGTEN